MARRIVAACNPAADHGDVAPFVALLSWRTALEYLGDASYALGRVEEGQAAYAQLAPSLLSDRFRQESLDDGKVDVFKERPILAAMILANDRAGLHDELALLDARIPQANRSPTDSDWEGVERQLLQTGKVRVAGLYRAGRDDAALAELKAAIARGEGYFGAGTFETEVIKNQIADEMWSAGKLLETSGDRPGAANAFRRLDTLVETLGTAGGLTPIATRNFARVSAGLRDHDPGIKLQDAVLVFPSFTDAVDPAGLAEINGMTGLPTADSIRASVSVNRNARMHEILAKALGEDHPDSIQHLGFYAHDLDQDGQYAKAAEVQEQVVEREAGLLGELNRAVRGDRRSLATMLLDAGRKDEAIATLAKLVTGERPLLAAGDGDALTSAQILHNWLAEDGRYAEALSVMQAIAAGAPKAPAPGADEAAFAMNALGEPILAPDRIALQLGGDLHELGRFAEAERQDRAARDARVKRFGPDHPNTAIAELQLAGDVAAQPGRAHEAFALASKHYATLLAVSRDAWVRYETPDLPLFKDNRAIAVRLRPAFLDSAYALKAENAAEAQAPAFLDAAFAALQDGFYQSSALAVAHNAAKRYAQSVGAGGLVEQREAMTGRITAAVAAVEQARGQGGAEDAQGRLDTELEAADKLSAQLAAQLQGRAPRYSGIVAQPPLTVAAAQALMRPDEAALLILPEDSGTHLVAVTRDGFSWVRTAATAAQLDAMVARLRRDLDPTVAIDDSYDRKTAFQLYQAVIAPVADRLANKAILYVVAAGRLAELPFGVLVTEPPAPGSSDADPDTLRQTRWFADQVALVQLPSLRALASERELAAAGGRPAAGAASYLGYGDPLLAGAAMTRGARGVRGAAPPAADALVAKIGAVTSSLALMDPALLRGLPSLPGTRSELEAMRSTLGAPPTALHMEGAMREAAFRATDLSRVRVLHIATHGLTAAQSGTRAEPGLVFTPPAAPTARDDGYLAASEVAGLDLASADWVILSACNSAAPAGSKDSSGLSGLARAFMLAGARSLLVSHWPVYDTVAARLTVDVLRRGQVPGTSRAQAMQQAMRAIREDRSTPGFAHPSAWAPFALVGEGQ